MNIYSEDKMYESYSSEVERMQKCIDELQQENQELKLELSGYRQAILKDKEMLGLKEENDKLKKQLKKKNKPQIFIDTQDMEERYAEGLYQDYLEEENKQLKKKLEEKENIACNWKDSCLENAGKIEILETQQKEFIKWLEDYLNLFDYRDIQEQAGYDMLEEILQKYREITGE